MILCRAGCRARCQHLSSTSSLTVPSPPTLCPAARGIVRQHGVRGLYRGLGVTVLEIMPYAALQFGLYDVFNKACNKARVREARAVRTGAAAPAA